MWHTHTHTHTHTHALQTDGRTDKCLYGLRSTWSSKFINKGHSLSFGSRHMTTNCGSPLSISLYNIILLTYFYISRSLRPIITSLYRRCLHCQAGSQAGGPISAKSLWNSPQIADTRNNGAQLSENEFQPKMERTKSGEFWKNVLKRWRLLAPSTTHSDTWCLIIGEYGMMGRHRKWNMRHLSTSISIAIYLCIYNLINIYLLI